MASRCGLTHGLALASLELAPHSTGPNRLNVTEGERQRDRERETENERGRERKRERERERETERNRESFWSTELLTTRTALIANTGALVNCICEFPVR